MLDVRDLTAHYGKSKTLFGMSFTVGDSEIVALVGRNGMGKTTAIRAVMGIPPVLRSGGTISYGGKRIDQWPSHAIAKLGLGIVPEGRHVFPTLSVRENLLVTARGDKNGRAYWGLEEVYALFPRLKARARQSGATLSGGEQQMLAIGRALMTNPALLILDEATEGLAPMVREEIWAALTTLKGIKISILIVDKNLEDLATFVDRFLVVERGEIVAAVTAADANANIAVIERYLSI
jgi:branched-chain amino acid transport system ATP-binding protein